MNTQNYIREDLRSIVPYSSARDEFEGQGDVFLDANENGLTTDYNRYPDPLQRKLKATIANVKGLPAELLCLGNGSDEILDLLLRLTCKSFEDTIAFLTPSYGMYSVLARVNGLKTKEIPLESDFSLDFERLTREISGTKVLIICNPNNPTGNAFDKQQLLETVAGFEGVVIVDEAYADFCPEVSLAGEVEQYDNLIVVQTLSKCYGMAGLRVGMAIANKQWIKALNSIKPPYNISGLVQEAAIRTLENTNWKTIKQTIISERERIAAVLAQTNIVQEVFPSASNFILFRVEDAGKLYAFLLGKGVVVRNRSTQYGCKNTLRVSIGTIEENNRFIEALTSF